MTPHDVLEWGKAVGVIVGLPAHLAISATVLWQTLYQNRELRVVRRGIGKQLVETGSIHPPQFAPKKRQESLVELERALDESDRTSG